MTHRPKCINVGLTPDQLDDVTEAVAWVIAYAERRHDEDGAIPPDFVTAELSDALDTLRTVATPGLV